jgi:hypothetical protein
MTDATQPELPPGTPDDVRRFVECAVDTLVLKPGKLDWLDLDVSPDVSFEQPKGQKDTVTVNLGVFGQTVGSIPVSVVGGRLVLDASQWPSVLPGKDAADEWVRHLNDWLRAQHRKFGGLTFRRGQVTLNKLQVTDGNATSSGTGSDASSGTAFSGAITGSGGAGAVYVTGGSGDAMSVSGGVFSGEDVSGAATNAPVNTPTGGKDAATAIGGTSGDAGSGAAFSGAVTGGGGSGAVAVTVTSGDSGDATNAPVTDEPTQGDPTLDTGHYDDGHSFGWKSSGTDTGVEQPTLPPNEVFTPPPTTPTGGDATSGTPSAATSGTTIGGTVRGSGAAGAVGTTGGSGAASAAGEADSSKLSGDAATLPSIYEPMDVDTPVKPPDLPPNDPFTPQPISPTLEIADAGTSTKTKVAVGGGILLACCAIAAFLVIDLGGGSSTKNAVATQTPVVATPTTLPTVAAASAQVFWTNDFTTAQDAGNPCHSTNTVRYTITDGAKFAGQTAIVVFFGLDYRSHPTRTFPVGADGTFSFVMENTQCYDPAAGVDNQTGTALVSVGDDKNLVPPTDAVVPH